MSQLMGKHSADLIGGHGIDKVIIQHNGLQLAEARKVSIQLGCAAGSVHDLNGFHLVAMLGQQTHQLFLQFALFQGNELIADAAENRI